MNQFKARLAMKVVLSIVYYVLCKQPFARPSPRTSIILYYVKHLKLRIEEEPFKTFQSSLSAFHSIHLTFCHTNGERNISEAEI